LKGKIPALELFSTYMHSPLLWFSGHMGEFVSLAFFGLVHMQASPNQPNLPPFTHP